MGCCQSEEDTLGPVAAPPRHTYVMLGDSGVGKTTLLRHLQLSMKQISPNLRRDQYGRLVRHSVEARLRLLARRGAAGEGGESPELVAAFVQMGEVLNEAAISSTLLDAIDEVGKLVRAAEDEALGRSDEWKEPDGGEGSDTEGRPRAAPARPAATSDEIEALAATVRSLVEQGEHFTPSDEDILRHHWPTSGMLRHDISRLRFIDAGGAPAERRKWHTLADDMVKSNVSLLFVVSLREGFEASLDVLRMVLREPVFKSMPLTVVCNQLDAVRLGCQRQDTRLFEREFGYAGELDVQLIVAHVRQRLRHVCEECGVTTEPDVLVMSALDSVGQGSPLRNYVIQSGGSPKATE